MKNLFRLLFTLVILMGISQISYGQILGSGLVDSINPGEGGNDNPKGQPTFPGVGSPGIGGLSFYSMSCNESTNCGSSETVQAYVAQAGTLNGKPKLNFALENISSNTTRLKFVFKMTSPDPGVIYTATDWQNYAALITDNWYYGNVVTNASITPLIGNRWLIDLDLDLPSAGGSGSGVAFTIIGPDTGGPTGSPFCGAVTFCVSSAEISTTGNSWNWICTKGDDYEFTDYPCGGNKMMSISSLVISPNPASDYIDLGIYAEDIIVIDLTGKKYMLNQFKGGTSVNVSGLNSGHYIIKVIDELGQVHIEKLILN